MIKKAKLILCLALMACLLLQLPILTASADTATISAPTKGYVGEEITVTYTIKCDHHSKLGSAMGYLKYDASYFQVISAPTNADGANKIEDGKYKFVYNDATGSQNAVSFTFKFKVLKPGSAGVSLEATEIVSADLSSESARSASVGITLVDRSTLSSNATLKKLGISVGTLSPAFDPDIYNYTVNVDYSVTQLIVSCVTAEKDAVLKVTGSQKLKVGKNLREIGVIAPNGVTKKLYTITITRAAKNDEPVSEPEIEVNPYEILVSREKRYIVNDYTGIEIPAGFTLSTKVINGIEMPVLVNATASKVLVYALDNQEATGCYCLYDEATNTFTIYKIFSSSNQKYLALSPESNIVPVGYYATTQKLGGYLVDGYKYNDTKKADFFIFYGENELGIKGYYRYDATDSSVQRATEFTDAMNKNTTQEVNGTLFENFASLEAKEKAVVIAGISLILVVIALIIITAIRIYKTRNPQTHGGEKHESESEESNLFLNFIEDSQNKKVTFNEDFVISDEESKSEEEGTQEE